MNQQIDILYADDDLIIVNKPPQLLSVPGRGEHKQDCLVNRLQVNFPGVRIVHRLDCDTSGIMVLAMHAESHRRLSKQFEQRLVDKTYLARVEGHLPRTQGGIDLPLALDWHHRPMHKVDFVYGKPAQTAWQVLSITDSTTLVRLFPHTGRSHQLRVHMLSMGCPMVGDMLYHPRHHEYHRMCLHAEMLSFSHPNSGEAMKFTNEADF
ncbi:MAG: RluA family pseudouridine synthase [Gammaproteobacteria bacterium]|nr:RluA family pseudouridine synthase [Gammaproteobacteria bacterium]